MDRFEYRFVEGEALERALDKLVDDISPVAMGLITAAQFSRFDSEYARQVFSSPKAMLALTVGLAVAQILADDPARGTLADPLAKMRSANSRPDIGAFSK